MLKSTDDYGINEERQDFDAMHDPRAHCCCDQKDPERRHCALVPRAWLKIKRGVAWGTFTSCPAVKVEAWPVVDANIGNLSLIKLTEDSDGCLDLEKVVILTASAYEKQYDVKH